ncbi:MAG: hypothetical protein GY798_05110 [Hyphomicrobiales bacterium]|nr:hypothetical protein [Hyphomicrobiales bacterium]
MTIYDWILLAGVLYTGIGSDLLLNWAAGLITGKRLRADSSNPFERLYHTVHARNDPNMRADPPVDGPADRIAAWNHGLAVGNGTIVLALEVLIVFGFLSIWRGEPLPDAARLAAFAWLMRGVWGELSYWHVLTAGQIEPLRGGRLVRYWIIGMPQAFLPFMVAERFYGGTADYTFQPLRFAAFLAVPIAIMVLMKLSYRGRVW